MHGLSSRKFIRILHLHKNIMGKHRLTEEEWRIHDQMQKRLQAFPLYGAHQRIVPHVCAEDIIVSYPCASAPLMDKTQFSIQTNRREPAVWNITTFSIAPMYWRDERLSQEQRPRYGTLLCRCIEDFCRNEGGRYLRTTPSGQGLEFFPTLGFRRINAREFEKNLT